MQTRPHEPFGRQHPLIRHGIVGSDEPRPPGLPVIDDAGDRRLEADLAFYPPVPQVKRMNWDGFTGALHVGWEWAPLRREFSEPVEREPHDTPKVLVTMGGSDPAGMTLKAVAALDGLAEDFDTVVILGAAFSHDDALQEILAGTRRRFDIRRNVADMRGLMVRADLAVASFGVTAYELAAMGVPTVYLCLTSDHAESASALVDAGMAVSLGVHENVSTEDLAESVRSLLTDPDRRERMSQSARKKVDGRGAQNIAREIVGRMEHVYG